MIKLFTLAQNRLDNDLVKYNTLPQKLGKIEETTPVSGYKKTSLSLKHKEEGSIFQRIKDDYQEYCGRIISDEILGLIPKGTKPRMLEEWMIEKGFKMD